LGGLRKEGWERRGGEVSGVVVLGEMGLGRGFGCMIGEEEGRKEGGGFGCRVEDRGRKEVSR
jgi:hypothetical protein